MNFILIALAVLAVALAVVDLFVVSKKFNAKRKELKKLQDALKDLQAYLRQI